MVNVSRKNSYRWFILAVILFLLTGCAASSNGNDKEPVIKEDENTAKEVASSPVNVDNPADESNAQEGIQYGFTVDGNHITGKVAGNPDKGIQDCIVDADIKPFPSSNMKTYKIPPSAVIRFEDFKKKVVPAVLPQGQNIQKFTFKDESFTDAMNHKKKTTRYSASKGNAWVTYYTTEIVYGNKAEGEVLANEELFNPDQVNIPGYTTTNDQARKIADEYVDMVTRKLGSPVKIQYDKTDVFKNNPSFIGGERKNIIPNYSIQYAMNIDGVNTETDMYNHLIFGQADIDNDGIYEITKGFGFMYGYGNFQISITDEGIQEARIRVPDKIQEVDNKPVISPEKALQSLNDMENLDFYPRKITGIEPVYLAVETGFDENMNKEFQLTPYWRIATDDIDYSQRGNAPLRIYVDAYNGVPLSFRTAAPEGFVPAEE